MTFLDKLIYIYFIYYLGNEYQTASNRESLDNKSTTSTNRISSGNNSNNASNDLRDIELQKSDIRKTTKHIVSK